MSIWNTTKRVARYGFIGFLRNGFVSLSAILIMTITLFVMGALLVGGAALDSTLRELTNKVDVNVYFATNASEAEIMAISGELQQLPEVASVEYTSREEALAEFRDRHKNEQSTIQALDQLADNPLGASLAVRARETSQYESIAQYLEAKQDTPEGASITTINFHRNKTAIDRLTSLINASRTVGFAIAALLAGASVLIAFNTIRLAIYTARDEIGVMNLVGASHWYVRGPFVIAGMLYGVVSAIIVLAVMYPAAAWLGPPSERFFGTFNVFDYYTGNFAYLLLVMTAIGIVLGSISSFLAVRRYLHS